MSTERFGIIAHRGASGYAPENTAAAFDLAIELGATAIEIDVQMTRDGHLVVWHDDTTDRTGRFAPTTRSARVGDLTLAELRSYDIGSWFNDDFPLLADPRFANLSPMTLDEVVSRHGDELPLFIEPKGVPARPGMLRELVRCLSAATGGRSHAVLARQPRCLEAVLKECPGIVPVLLLDRNHQAADLHVAAAARIGAHLSPHKDLVDARLVAQAHWNVVPVYPHTVNHPGEIRRLVEVGVDGVITDLPDHALLVRERLTGQLSPAVPA